MSVERRILHKGTSKVHDTKCAFLPWNIPTRNGPYRVDGAPVPVTGSEEGFN